MAKKIIIHKGKKRKDDRVEVVDQADRGEQGQELTPKELRARMPKITKKMPRLI